MEPSLEQQNEINKKYNELLRRVAARLEELENEKDK